MIPSYDGPFSHPRGQLMVGLIEALFEAAALAARAAARAHKKRRLAKLPLRGRTLRPGEGTPLWNELLRLAAPLLVRRGSKAQLARVLGLPRQRLQDCLKAKKATLDAERTLQLLLWVATRRQGRDILN